MATRPLKGNRSATGSFYGRSDPLRSLVIYENRRRVCPYITVAILLQRGIRLFIIDFVGVCRV